MSSSSSPASPHRRHYGGVIADRVDFRDRMYTAGLVDVPLRIRLDEYRDFAVPILDQGNEPACTGFGLATVAHYLLRRRRVDRDETRVSPRMFYEVAKRYDEWAGEQHKGSSCRGAMKGWDKHGVCAETLWPYQVGDDVCVLTHVRATDALKRPLGAYFRVNAKDLTAMHSALVEVGVLYVMAGVHEGWHQVAQDGSIPWPMPHIGAHAFAVVAYDANGFWVQNSKGTDWGLRGFARLSYEDWLANGQDVWIVRLGVPIAVRPGALSRGRDGSQSHHPHAFAALRPYIVSLTQEGLPRRTGTYATGEDDIASLIGTELPQQTKDWPKRRILLYAPSGLVDEKTGLQRIDAWRDALLAAQIYPIVLNWQPEFATAMSGLLEKVKQGLAVEPPGGGGNAAATPGLDEAIEPIARREGGAALWARLKDHAARATTEEAGGGRLVAQQLAGLAGKFPNVEIHLLGHSLGALLLAPLVKLLTGTGALPEAYGDAMGLGVPVASCSLWAPACTIDQFSETVSPKLGDGSIGRFTLFTLSDAAEKNDTCAGVYDKSLLYLIAKGLEEAPRLLGLETAVRADHAMTELLHSGRNDWIVASGAADAGSRLRSSAQHHDDFAGDAPTWQATIDLIVGAAEPRQ
jgi:Papain family cysteine protease